MAQKEEVIIQIKEEGAGKTMAELRNEFKQLQNELSKTKVGTKEYADTLRKLGEVKGEMKDLREQIQLLDPGEKAVVFGRAIQGIAGGVQAATGAMALFGVESEEAQKTLVQLQAAANLTAGVQSVMELGKAFQALKIIMMENPIMLIGTIVAAAAVAIYGLVQALDDTEEQIANTKKAIEQYKQAQDNATASIDNQIKVLKAQGKETFELEKQKLEVTRDSIMKQIELQERLIALKKEDNEEEKKRLDELKRTLAQTNTDIEVLEINHQKEIEKQRAEEHQKYLDRLKEQEEAIIKSYQKRQSTIDFYTNEALKFANKEKDEDIEIRRQALDARIALIEEEMAKLDERKKKGILINKELTDELYQQWVQLNNELLALELEQDKRKQDREALAEQQRQEQAQKTLADIQKQQEDAIAVLEYNKQLQLALAQDDKQKQFEIEQNFQQQKLDLLQNYANLGLQNDEKIRQTKEQMKIRELAFEVQKEREKQAAIMQLKQNAVANAITLSNSVFQVLNNLAQGDVKKQKELARVKFNIDKALNITQATMNTYTAVTKALASMPPPLNAIQAAIIGALGLAQVTAIVSQQYQEQGTATAPSTPSTPSTPTSAGTPTQVEPTAPTQQPLSPTGLSIGHSQQGDVAEGMIVRAYVVEQDIRDTSKKKDVIMALSGY